MRLGLQVQAVHNRCTDTRASKAAESLAARGDSRESHLSEEDTLNKCSGPVRSRDVVELSALAPMSTATALFVKRRRQCLRRAYFISASAG